MRSRSVVTIGVILLACGIVAGLGAALDLHVTLGQKLRDYFGSASLGELADRALSLEGRTGFFRALPVLAPLALLAGLRRRLDGGELPLLVCITVGVILFAPFSYSPLRYLIVLFPAVCVLAASTVTMLLTRPREQPERPGVRARAIRTPVLLFLAYGWASALSPESTAATVMIWLLASAIVLVALWAPARWRTPRIATRPRFAALAITAAIGVQLLRSGTAYADMRHTTRAAVEDMQAVLAPDAVVSGLFSHLLTTGNTLDRKLVSASRFGDGVLRRTFEHRKVTHLTMNSGEHVPETLARFAADGAPLRHVHTFHVRGIAILVLRFEFADAYYSRSTYEHGVTAFEEGRQDDAIAHFEKAAREFPDRAAPVSALAMARLARGEPAKALDSCRKALSLNPWDLRALGVEADILLRDRRPVEARTRLERMRDIDPANAAVRQALERLESVTND
jgi:tetratricopeptide (TPR) repeat protein